MGRGRALANEARHRSSRGDARGPPLARAGLDPGEDDRPPAFETGAAGLAHDFQRGRVGGVLENAANDLFDGTRL
eukprot:7489063-Pyramimonas_sp.AAC.1